MINNVSSEETYAEEEVTSVKFSKTEYLNISGERDSESESEIQDVPEQPVSFVLTSQLSILTLLRRGTDELTLRLTLA